jgi:hypothetical protein
MAVRIYFRGGVLVRDLDRVRDLVEDLVGDLDRVRDLVEDLVGDLNSQQHTGQWGQGRHCVAGKHPPTQLGYPKSDVT